MVTYLLIVSVFLGLMGIAWRRDDILNLLIKCIVLGLSLWGWFLVLLEMGYVVKS